MAANTKAKRASIQAYTIYGMRPPPDGTVGAGDRATVAGFYAGITYANPAPVVEATYTFVRGLVRNLVGTLVRKLTV